MYAALYRGNSTPGLLQRSGNWPDVNFMERDTIKKQSSSLLLYASDESGTLSVCMQFLCIPCLSLYCTCRSSLTNSLRSLIFQETSCSFVVLVKNQNHCEQHDLVLWKNFLIIRCICSALKTVPKKCVVGHSLNGVLLKMYSNTVEVLNMFDELWSWPTFQGHSCKKREYSACKQSRPLEFRDSKFVPHVHNIVHLVAVLDEIDHE
jgi:hypothetical protein